MPNGEIVKCAGCKKPIDKKYVQALGKNWHLEHFKCAKCSKIISKETFLEKHGRPYCKKDYMELFCQKCSKCKEYILTEAVEALDKFWHVNCFTCKTCQRPIKPPHFFVKQGIPYCTEDYKKKFVPLCKGCGEFIFDDQLKVMGGIWHCKCFTCNDCEKPIKNKYFLLDMKPVCITCMGNKKPNGNKCYQSCCSLNHENEDG